MTDKKISPQARTAARQRLVQALYQWAMTGEDVQVIETQFMTEENMQRVDIQYFHTLLHEIPAQISALDEALSPLLDRPLTQLNPVEHAILRLGCYELKHCPDIPWRVIINEAVNLAKKFGAGNGHRYVNGVLDKLAHIIHDKP